MQELMNDPQLQQQMDNRQSQRDARSTPQQKLQRLRIMWIASRQSCHPNSKPNESFMLAIITPTLACHSEWREALAEAVEESRERRLVLFARFFDFASLRSE